MFWQLPIIRVLHSGRSSVTIFFIMSGYVMTVKTPWSGSTPSNRIQRATGHPRGQRPFRSSCSIAGVLALGCWLVQLGDFDQALFCAGLLLAEIPCLVPLDESASHTTSTTLSPYRHWRNCFALAARHAWAIALFILALHLLSYPEIRGPATPGFRTISKLVPGFYKGDWERIQQFWISVGSVLFIVALIFSPPLHLPYPDSAALPPSSTTVETQRPLLQRPFTTRFAQYLGRISYSLYLAHGAVNHTAAGAADAALSRAWRDYCAQALCAALINTLVLVWASDLFWRAINARAVRAARWLWGRALAAGAE
ncbi:hypothetical protein DL765_008643 [Monosporascus sp. GIB2]|nr:hypothetical protein DL765_008643 [Monosporascus sp. GIB2]